MKYISNSKGYSLLFTLSTLVLITVLGISLITLSSSGLVRNESRENVALASDLSEKGVQYLTNSINKDLEAYIEALKNGSTTVDKAFADILLKYGCSATNTKDVVIDGKTGKTSVCIEHIESRAEAEANNRRNTRLVTIRSTGQAAQDKQAGTRTVMELGYSDIPEQLSYAVSSNDNGNIYFFGGTEVRGNIKLAGDMYVSDQAFFDTVNSPDWVQSVYPKLLGHEADKPSIIYSDKNYVYKFKNNPDKLSVDSNNIYTTNKDGTQFARSIEKVTGDALANTFTGSKPVFRTYQGVSHPFIIDKKPAGYELFPSKFEEMLALDSNYKDEHRGTFSKIDEDYTVENNMVLHIKDYSYKDCNQCQTKKEYGHMKIGKYATGHGSSNDPNHYSSIELSGNYYVDGDVHIKGVKLKSNAVIYAKGNVEIAYSTIEPLNNGTLFIFADGNIKINNISVDSLPGKGSIINGYFYSNKDFLMYGVGSNTTITGGISARNIIYTTVRGNAQGKGIKEPYTVNPNCGSYDQKDRQGVNCIQLKSNTSALTLNLTNQQRSDIDAWISALGNKVQYSRRSYRYVNPHTISRGSAISNEELKMIQAILNNPNSVSAQHMQLVDKMKRLANGIPNHMRSFYYTDGRLDPITRQMLKSYQLGSKRQQLQQTLQELYVYSAKKLLQQCQSYGDSTCDTIKERYGYLTPEYAQHNSSTDSIENQLTQPSRLTIIYDRELVTRYRKTTEDDLSAVQDLSIFKQKVHAMEPF